MQQARNREAEQAVEVEQDHEDGTCRRSGRPVAEAIFSRRWWEWTQRESPGGGAVFGRIPREAEPRGRFQRTEEVSGVEAKAMKVGCRFITNAGGRAVWESLEGAPGNG